MRPKFLAVTYGQPGWDEVASEYASTSEGHNLISRMADVAQRKHRFDVEAHIRQVLNRGMVIRETNTATAAAISSHTQEFNRAADAHCDECGWEFPGQGNMCVNPQCLDESSDIGDTGFSLTKPSDLRVGDSMFYDANIRTVTAVNAEETGVSVDFSEGEIVSLPRHTLVVADSPYRPKLSTSDDVVPTGELVAGRSNIVEHIIGGNARYGERVNLRFGKNEYSGVLEREVDGHGNVAKVYVKNRDGRAIVVFDATYNNLTSPDLAGFRYQRSTTEAAAR